MIMVDNSTDSSSGAERVISIITLSFLQAFDSTPQTKNSSFTTLKRKLLLHHSLSPSSPTLISISSIHGSSQVRQRLGIKSGTFSVLGIGSTRMELGQTGGYFWNTQESFHLLSEDDKTTTLYLAVELSNTLIVLLTTLQVKLQTIPLTVHPMGWAQLSEFWASPLYMTLTKNEKKLKLCCAMPHACLDEEVMDHFEGSLFLQDEDVRADNDPLAWEDIEGCCVPKNYTKEVQGIDCNLDKFFGDTFYDNWDERLVDGIDELGVAESTTCIGKICRQHTDERDFHVIQANVVKRLYAKDQHLSGPASGWNRLAYFVIISWQFYYILMRKRYQEEICVLASSGKAEFNELRDKFRNELLNLKQKKDLGQTSMQTGVAQSSTLEGCVRDPQLARFPKRERNDLINHPLVKGG
ncbi:hypothetical protein HN873_010721 [Arachis hypogaea]